MAIMISSIIFKKALIVITTITLSLIAGIAYYRFLTKKNAPVQLTVYLVQQPNIQIDTTIKYKLLKPGDINSCYWAEPATESLHIYLKPNASAKFLSKVIARTDLRKPFLKIEQRSNDFCQTSDSGWIPRNELKSYYSKHSPWDKLCTANANGPLSPDAIINLFGSEAFSINGNIALFYDSALTASQALSDITLTMKIIGRRKEGYLSAYPASTDTTIFNILANGSFDLNNDSDVDALIKNLTACEIFKVRVNRMGKDSLIGWVRSEEIIFNKTSDLPGISLFESPLGQKFDDPSNGWYLQNSHWLKLGQSIINLDPCFESWVSPDKRFVLTVGPSTTKIRRSDGNVIINLQHCYTSPVWYNNFVFVRGLDEDDGIYAINLKTRQIEPLYSFPGKPDCGDADGYFSWPAPTIDTINERFKVIFERNVASSYRTRHYTVILNISGEPVKIDSSSTTD